METRITNEPESSISFPTYNLSSDFLDQFGTSLYEGIDLTRGQRDTLDQTLDYWNDMVEMNVAPRDTPWPNAKSMCVPIVAMMMEAVYSRLVSAVFVPRLYALSALNSQGADYVHDVENWYNAEFRRRHWLREHLDTLFLSLRDGVAIMEVLWEKKEVSRKMVFMEPTGEVNPDGTPKKKKVVKDSKSIEFNGPRLTPVELRDFFLLPATAKSIEKASAVYRKLYLTESELLQMCEGDEPVLIRERVDRVLAMHSTGINDLQSDPQGTATYEQGGTLTVGDTGSSDPEIDGEGTKSRGIYQIWRVHTNEYDLDQDGEFEENVAYIDEMTQMCIGVGPYQYWMKKRPFVKCAPMPRPLRFQGWSVPERERGYQEEANARSNQRGDAMDLKISPPLYQVSTAKLLTKENSWGPHAKYEVQSKGDVGIIDVGSIDPASWQDESLIYRYAAAMVGLEAPTAPLMGNQKIPARQQQAMQQASNIRLDLMAMEVRLFCEEVLERIHSLNLQYGDDESANDLQGSGMETSNDGKKFKIPYEALTFPYLLGVAGVDGAIDQDTDLDKSIKLYAMLLQNPLVQGNLSRVHEATSYVLNRMNLPDFTRFIGTKEEAQQQQQAQQQAQQKVHDEQMQMQIIAHAKNTPPESKPPQAPGPPPQAALQMDAMNQGALGG